MILVKYALLAANAVFFLIIAATSHRFWAATVDDPALQIDAGIFSAVAAINLATTIYIYRAPRPKRPQT